MADLVLIIGQVIAGAIWAFAVASFLIPLVPTAHGAVRFFDFCRAAQVPVAAAGALLPALLFSPPWSYLMAATALMALAGQMAFLWRYSPLSPKMSVAPRAGEEGLDLTLLLANVKQSNRDYDRLCDLVRKEDPDLFVAQETDEEWVEGLAPVRDRFEAHHDVPRDTGYGMVIWSKWPLSDVECLEEVTKGAPSYSMTVSPPDARPIRLRAIHPEPPTLHRDTEARDVELLDAASEAKADEMPFIVLGDFNDVPWSPGLRRMLRLSGLCDPRVGRGLYNSFSAKNPLLRWPLDQLLHDQRFRLIKMTRAGRIGSDHYPMLWKLRLTDDPGPSEGPAEPYEEDQTVQRETLEREAGRNRRAAGENWEKEEEEAKVSEPS